MKYYLSIFLLFATSTASSRPKETLIHFLELVQERSVSLKLTESQLNEGLASAEQGLGIFDRRIGANFGVNQQRPTPDTSGFIDNRQTVFGQAGYNQLWKSGWQTGLSFQLARTELTGAPQIEGESYVPDLSASISTNLGQDVLGKRLAMIPTITNQRKQVLGNQSKLARKEHLVSSLLTLSGLLEIEENIALQKKLCRRIQKQTAKLEQRNKKGVVNRKDYLLSKKELNGCRSTIKTLTKQSISLKESLGSTFGVPFAIIGAIDIKNFYKQVEEVYRKFSRKSSSYTDLPKQEEIVALEEEQKLLTLLGQQLSAENAIDLSLSFKAGVKGYDDDLGGSFGKMGSGTYPYGEVALSYQLPLKDRELKSRILANQYSQESIKHRLALTIASKSSRLKVLSQTLNQDFAIYKDLSTNVKLSEEILNVAEKEFNNGRIDFFRLTEFQKGLISSQTQLASVRAQIIRNTVEFIDFFDFFDRFY